MIQVSHFPIFISRCQLAISPLETSCWIDLESKGCGLKITILSSISKKNQMIQNQLPWLPNPFIIWWSNCEVNFFIYTRRIFRVITPFMIHFWRILHMWYHKFKERLTFQPPNYTTSLCLATNFHEFLGDFRNFIWKFEFWEFIRSWS